MSYGRKVMPVVSNDSSIFNTEKLLALKITYGAVSADTQSDALRQLKLLKLKEGENLFDFAVRVDKLWSQIGTVSPAVEQDVFNNLVVLLKLRFQHAGRALDSLQGSTRTVSHALEMLFAPMSFLMLAMPDLPPIL